MWSIIEPSLGILAGCLPTAYSLYLAIVRRNDHLTVAAPNRNNSRSGTTSAKTQSGNKGNGCFPKFRSLYLTIVRNDDRPAPSPASSQSTLGNICVTKTLEVMRIEKGEEDVVDSGNEFGCTAWVRSSATPGPFGSSRTWIYSYASFVQWCCIQAGFNSHEEFILCTFFIVLRRRPRTD